MAGLGVTLGRDNGYAGYPDTKQSQIRRWCVYRTRSTLNDSATDLVCSMVADLNDQPPFVLPRDYLLEPFHISRHKSWIKQRRAKISFTTKTRHLELVEV